MKWFFLILTLISASAQDIFLPWIDAGVNGLKRGALAFYQFNEGSGATTADATGHGYTLTANTGTAGATPWAPAAGLVGNGAGMSSGTTAGDNFEAPANWPAFAFPGKHMTMTVWANFTDPPTSVNDPTLVCRGDKNGPNFSWWLSLDAAGGANDDALYFYYSTDGSAVVFGTTPFIRFRLFSRVSAGWNFLVVRWDGVNLKISLTPAGDSVLATESTSPFSGAFFENGTAKIRVGESISQNQTWDMSGYIDELGFWDTELTPCQLLTLFAAKSGSFTWSGFDFGYCP